LLKDASDNQQDLMINLFCALILAIKIGHALLKLKKFIPHGQTQQFLIENFCTPNNVSLRTAERYQFIARNSEAMLRALRSDNHELESKTDDEILKQLSINDAYALVKQLAKIEDGKVSLQSITVSKPDANGWVTPPWLMALVEGFLERIDADPTPIESRAELITSNTDPIAIEATPVSAPWTGRVWINPGIHKVDHTHWVERLIAEFRAGSVEEGLILVPAVMNSKYATLLRDFPLGFLRAPFEVSGPQLSATTIKCPMMIAYVGPKSRYTDFASAFSKSDTIDVFVPASSHQS
jgi:hypothetical protein